MLDMAQDLELTEQDKASIRLARAYTTSFSGAAVPGHNLLCLIVKLTKRLSALDPQFREEVL